MLQPLHSKCQDAHRQGQRVSTAVVARAMPFQLPSAAQRFLKSNPLRLPQQLPVPPQQPPSTSQQPEQQQQSTLLTAEGPVAPAPVTSTSSSALATLKFAKHLATVSNGCAPPMSRFESTGWLLFESKQLQSALIGPTPHTVNSWVCNAEGLQLLEQIYLVGAAIAELGTADGLQPLSSSNGSRAIVSLDYSRLLERYLQQHGHLLAEEFWSGLHAFDDLQARAIHVATALETRCMVHAMLFDKLIERVGTEGTPASAWGGSWAAPGSAPLATAITNTMINTTQQHSAPVTTQSTVAAPSAVNSNSGNNSNVASSESTTAAAQPAVHGVWGYIGQLGAVFLLLCTVAGKVVQVVIAVVSFARDMVLQLLMLRAVSAGAKAVAAKAKAGAGRPALAFAGAGGSAASLPGAGGLQQARQLPAAGAGVSYAEQPSAAAVLLPAGLTTGSLGLLGAVTVRQKQQQPAERGELQQQQQQQQLAPWLLPKQQQQQQQEGRTVAPAPNQQQQQGQWQLAAPPVQPTVAWAPSQPAAATAAAVQQQQQPQTPVAAGHGSRKQRSPMSPQQRLRQGLQGGLGAAQSALGKAAARVSATAAAIPSALHSHQQRQQQLHQRSGGFKAGSRNLLYSLWSPADAGLQELEAEGAAGVRFADAGWGAGDRAVGVAVNTTEEAGW